MLRLSACLHTGAVTVPSPIVFANHLVTSDGFCVYCCQMLWYLHTECWWSYDCIHQLLAGQAGSCPTQPLAIHPPPCCKHRAGYVVCLGSVASCLLSQQGATDGTFVMCRPMTLALQLTDWLQVCSCGVKVCRE
jgi:hypothetical protein